jgi:ribosome maturation protein Sdo1
MHTNKNNKIIKIIRKKGVEPQTSLNINSSGAGVM